MAETSGLRRKRSALARPALALGLGGLFALGQAPWSLWYVALPALVLGVALISGARRPRVAGWSGWTFGVGYFAVSLNWITEPFQVDAAVTGWMAPFALVLIAAGLALFWALPAWASARIGQRWALVPLWTLAELARAYILTGFPWGLLGYFWTETPVAQWSAWIGPHGLVLLTLTTAMLAARAVTLRRPLPALAALALLAGLWGGGAARIGAMDEGAGPIVRLVQPNAPQAEKWKRDRIPVFFERLVFYTGLEPRPDLIVTPETVLPMMLDNAGEALAILHEEGGSVPMVIGVQRVEEGRYYNSAIYMNADGAVSQTYDKHHLVPFGEYMPAAWAFRHVGIGGLAQRAEYGYSAGPGPQLMDLGAIGKALPLICYEAVFPQDVRGTDERPALLLQLTNDAWFGAASGPYQHLAQARLRAIEQGLPVLRAANTGVSAVIDPWGRVLGSLPLGAEGALDLPLPPPGPVTLYARTGDIPVFLLLLALALLALTGRRRHSD
ncbi:apolipoprotein N-acyltransferase [Litorisediminicola beolgyonensis]|uniref:Apolipoprotein N-acyltransferase n=1 Tax=Litorisediminicola beolgyonensis TaxID=1173614 RepID=A0ABW3ZLK2_9RHOB